jgi:NitT/TauT family transport system ATP-binding protein
MSTTVPSSELPATSPPTRADRTSLAFRGISMTFPDGTRAVDDVSFEVAAGEPVTVVGPSGCGKSTLLRIASGLTPQTRGTVEVDRDSLGYVFQDPTLLQWRTVRGNVELLAELHGVPKGERRRRAQAAIELVGLAGSETKYPKQLSGGMKMRASLARSLVMQPNVFLFDEPFAAVDDHPGAPQRRVDAALQPRALRRPLHHPLDLRGGVPVDPGAGDVARPAASSASSPSPFPTRAPTSASSPPSPSSAAR